jgi:DNA invertase Pin-like site-specific DNA recombinase
MSERENGQLPLAKRTVRNRISSERWEQIKVAYVSGIGLREIARKMNIPEGTVLAHAKRHGWTQQIQVATQQQSDAITPVQPVPQSIAAILAEHERETKLSLARSARRMAKDAEEATLREAPYVHKAAQVASITHKWDQREEQSNVMVNIALLGIDPQSIRADQPDAQRGTDAEG